MVGWVLFGDHDPASFGNIGRALLTLFQILTLEGWNEVLDKEMELQLVWVYFVSFVLIGTFVVLNLVIAIIVNSMDEVREIERRRALEELAEEFRRAVTLSTSPAARYVGLRGALDELERRLRPGPPVSRPRRFRALLQLPVDLQVDPLVEERQQASIGSASRRGSG